jgi:hypothetical protein
MDVMTQPTHKLMQRYVAEEMKAAARKCQRLGDAHIVELWEAMYDAAPEPKGYYCAKHQGASGVEGAECYECYRENLSKNPENLYTSGECVKEFYMNQATDNGGQCSLCAAGLANGRSNHDCICQSPQPTKETAECGSKCQLDCENYVAAMYEIKEVVRVAKTNAQGLSLFLQQNFPKEWKEAPEPVCTPSCGNVFLDLGFPVDEARDLTIKAQEKHVVRLTTERDALKAELKEAVEALKEISLGSLVQREVDIVRAVLSKHPDGQGEW